MKQTTTQILDSLIDEAGKMEKKLKNQSGLLKCHTCGKPYKRISEYEYIGDCEHVPENMIISVG